MFFLLSKILLFLTSPFFWCSILVLLAFFCKKDRLRKRFRLAAIIATLFFSNTFIFLEFERQWEITGIKVTKIHKKYDVGIVLSGMAMYDNHLQRLKLNEGADRIWHAVTLYKKGIIRRILITGKDGTIRDRGLNEAQQFKRDLEMWGIPSKDILIEDKSRNTYENALFTKELLDQHPELKSFLLITSSNHMRRAAACFHKQDLTFDEYSTNVFTAPKREFLPDQLFVPSLETLLRWDNLTKEWVGFVVYKITGKC